MQKKIRDPKWQPKPLRTARRLAEISAEVDRLRRKVREAETAVLKQTATMPAGQPAANEPASV